MVKHNISKLLTTVILICTISSLNTSTVLADNNILTKELIENTSSKNSTKNNLIFEVKKEEVTRNLTLEDYKRKSAIELAELVKRQKVTAEELVNIAYEVIERENPELNAVVSLRKELALKEARELKNNNQPFLGVPLLLKGIGYTVNGGENTNALKTNEGKKLSTSDSSYTKKYKDLGFIILGQTNYPELALRNITNSNLYGLATNSWDKNYNAGGSSGGSATAISSGMTPISTASDMGGSIRIPASWNSLIGLKTSSALTTNGSRGGSPAVFFSLTKTVDDTKLLFDNLQNEKYKREAEKIISEIKDIKTLKIGYSLKSPMGTEVSKEAEEAVLESVKFLHEQGFVVEEVENPIAGRAVMEDYTRYSIANGSIAGNLEKDLKVKKLTKENLDPLVWALYAANKNYGKDLLKKDIEQVKANFAKYTEIMNNFHKSYPIFLTPTTATVAPLNTDSLIDENDKKAMYNIEELSKEEQYNLLLRQWEPMLKLTPFTQIANVTGEPAISLPTYLSAKNLPLGIMLNAAWGMDKILLDFAKVFENNQMFKIKEDILAKKVSIIEENISPQDFVKSEKNNKELKIEIIEKENKDNIAKELVKASNQENKIITREEKSKILSKTGVTNISNYSFLLTFMLAVILLKKKLK